MEIEILNQEKNVMELKIDNLTIVEILRAYLNKQGVKFAAWKREHPTKPAIIRIESSDKNLKKVVSEAISAIKKDFDKLVSLVKKG